MVAAHNANGPHFSGGGGARGETNAADLEVFDAEKLARGLNVAEAAHGSTSSRLLGACA